MARSVYVPQAGGFIDFSDDASDEEINSYLKSRFSAPAQAQQVAAPEEPTGPDESSILGRLAYGFGTGLTNIPGGIAALALPAEKAAQTTAGQFSEEARKYLQETFGIDPTKDPTAAQQAAEALGSVASFLVPGSAVAKGASLIGRTASLAGRAGTATAAAQGVALGSGARAEKIQNQLASGMEISEEDQLAAQRLDGFIGSLEAAPIGRFFGPITTLLSKVPVAKAPIVEQIVKSRLARITKAGAAEGAQEVASGIANDLVEYGVYNPDVEFGQDLLSNAGTGAFAGSFVEGLVQLAAGRKLKPYRQLQEDLGREAAVNAQAQRQGEISRAAEELRKVNVEGDVEIIEDDFDGISRFTIRTPGGNTVGDFLDAAEAEEAVGIYRERTDANITVRKPADLPSVFPVKLNSKEYQTTDQIIAERDNLVSKSEGLAAYMSRPDVIKREAARQNVSEALIRKATAEEVADMDKKISKLNEFVAAAKPTPEPEVAAPEAPAPEAVVPEAMAPEAPIGAAEPVSAEAPITEAPAVAEPVEPSEGPVEPPAEPEETRPSVGQLKEAPVVRRTLSQAEAEGPILRDYNQATIDRYAGIYTALKSRLSGKVPKNAEVKLEELISTPASLLVRGQARVEKTPNGIKSIVDLSTGILRPNMTVEEAVNELVETLDHEIIHVLRDQGVIRPAEWGMLSKAAVNTKVPGRSYTYLDKAQAVYTPNGEPIAPIYASPDAVIEEAVAEMYKDWVKGNNRKEVRRVGGLFNRITEFLRSIFRVLKSDRYKDVFKAIDTGEVGAREGVGREAAEGARFSAGPSYDPNKSTSDWETGGAPPPGISSVNKTGGSPFRISQRRPTSVRKAGASLLNNLLVDVSSMKLEPGVFEHNINIVNSYPGFLARPGENPEQTLKRFKKHVVDNLLWLHDKMDPNLRQRAKLWYDGARKITDGLAAKYNLPDTTVAAVLAGLSPQKDWFQNVSLAERAIDIAVTKRDVPFDDSMFDYAMSVDSIAQYAPMLQAMRGMTLNDMKSKDFESFLARKHNEVLAGVFNAEQATSMVGGDATLAKSIFIRVYDEANNSRSYNIITPEGDKGAIATTGKGKPSNVAWGSFTEIGKAANAIEDGTKENIDTLLGDKHKIRNFYNNIISPNSRDGSVTIDTHAVAAALMRALAGKSVEVHHNFGTSVKGMTYRTRNSSITGVQGMYAIYADAYREAAKLRGVLPREMQSITWEAVRGLYKPRFKGQGKNVQAIDDIWRLHSNGKITANEARKRTLELADPGAKGINSPFWKDTPSSVVYGVGGPALNTGGVRQVGLRQAAGRTGGGGTGADASSVKGTRPGGRFSAAPLPPYVEAKNRTLFVPERKESIVQSIFDFFSSPATQTKTLNTVYGQIDMKGGYFGTRAAINRRMSLVDKNAYFEWMEKTANEKDTGNFQRREATQSALVALGMSDRSSQLVAASVMQGAPVIEYSRPGDIQSATVAIRNDADKLIDIFRVMLEPGPVDPLTNKPRDKRVVFKSYATVMRAIGLKAAGKPVPRELDDVYINTTIQFVQRDYPEIVEAYNKYQRFNKKLITAARDAGRITDAELAKFTQQMDYYGFFREVYEEQLVPGMPSKLAGDIKIREYKGSERGDLIEDPMLVILTNVNFWMGAITRNIAVNKAFKLANDMGEARLLGASEKPDLSQGESEQVMFFRESGVQKRFAVKDPMLVVSLGADDRADMGGAMKLIGLPTTALRESVTRDPVFMIRNLLRDTLSSWITSGEDITPFIGTIQGFAKALNNSTSYQALVGRGVVGSHDLAMRSPAEMAAIIRRRASPKNIMNIASADGMQGLLMSAWDKLGVWSEASDAATRIAVYESAIKQGMSEAEAAFRAIEIMNFSRRGSSSFLQLLTRLVPFLNARIQGMDVLYQAGKAGVLTASGYQLGERDANLGKKFLYRGAILAALSVALEMMLDGDEDYEELPDYVKNGNLLLPLKLIGLDGYFAAVPKPFEAGLLFSTIPQELYKATTGETSGREMANFFWSEFTSTFGLNPIPQVALPALEAIVNYDFYTDLPLISEGKARLTPELQYDSRTSSVAMMLSGLPISYNFTTGRFEGVSPIIIDQMISGYGGPMGSYLMQGVGLLMEGMGAAEDRLPRDVTQLPGIKSFLLDAESRNPKSVAQAYELFRVVDEVNRSFSRLRQTGDVEATMDYLERNKDILAYKKHIYKLFDGLNKLSARERQIERDSTMTRDEKLEAMKQLREVRARLTSNISEINKALGR
jgi:hypothetical protein